MECQISAQILLTATVCNSIHIMIQVYKEARATSLRARRVGECFNVASTLKAPIPHYNLKIIIKKVN
jgi:hypothetical protein